MANILVVDDEADIRFLVSMILKTKGSHNVIEASNGFECLERIKETDLDMIILDIMMPDMDGWEVCQRIKETHPHISVSMLSAKNSDEDIKRSFEAGADRHLAKTNMRDGILNATRDLVENQDNN